MKVPRLNQRSVTGKQVGSVNACGQNLSGYFDKNWQK
jgi:hypothetical protein